MAGAKWLIHIYYRAVGTRGSVAIHFHRHQSDPFQGHSRHLLLYSRNERRSDAYELTLEETIPYLPEFNMP